MYVTQNFQRASNTLFFKSFSTYGQGLLYNRFCFPAPSTGKSERYEWFGEVPGVNEWIDERQIKAFKQFAYTLINKSWESTIGIQVEDYADDPSGQINARIPMMAASFAEHPEILLYSLLANGTVNLCFDGQPFFDAAHPALYEEGAAYSNWVNGTGITAALIQADFDTARALYQGYLKRNGIPVFIMPPTLTILHSPVLTAPMEVAFKQKFVTGTGVDNLYYQIATPIACGGLTGNDWFILIETPIVKPFVFQTRKGINPEWDEIRRFHDRKLYYGVDARYNMGYMFPQTAIMIDN